MDMTNHVNHSMLFQDGQTYVMCHTCNTRTLAKSNLVRDVKAAQLRHQTDVARQTMYDAYLRVCSVGRVAALSFSEWMVQRGFAYSTVDEKWVLI